MKRKLTLIKDKKFAISTNQVANKLYETSVFGVTFNPKASCVSISDYYDIDYCREYARFNCHSLREAMYHHIICVLYWSLKGADIYGEDLRLF